MKAALERGMAAKPTHLICGMLNTKDVAGYMTPLASVAQSLTAVAIPGEENTLPSEATAAAAQIPKTLLEQLRVAEEGRDGGRLVVPVGARDGQVMNRIVRTGEDAYQREELAVFRFVPLVGKGEGAMHSDGA